MTRPTRSALATALTLAALLVVSLLPSAAQAQQGRVYVVQPGDTLYRIATTNGLSVDQLKALNDLEANDIRVGQRLRLSSASETPPATPTTLPTTPPVETPTTTEPVTPPASGSRTVHTVQRGETLYRISLRYNTTVDELRRLNALSGDQIEVGQQLVVAGRAAAPAGTPATPSATVSTERRIPTLSTAERTWALDNTTVPSDLVHFVMPGETLYSIAAMYSLPSQALIDRNTITTAPLVPGEMLVLPEAVNPAWADPNRLPPSVQEGLALVYPDVMRGRPTSSGEVYDPLEFTASHREFPIGTLLLVTNPTAGRSTFVRVTDRGPVSEAYLLELSAAAATALDLDPNAARRVELRRLP